MRSSTLVLVFLISVQAVLNMRGEAKTMSSGAQPRPPSPDPRQWDSPLDLIPTIDPKLFNKRRYRSPRVLFSDVAPSEDQPARAAGGQRVRRKADQPLHRGEYSVCDSVNHWVRNMTRATDIAGKEVMVLPDVRINNIVKKQLFYETTCRITKPTNGRGANGGGPGGKGGGGAKSGASGCRGIDSRHWNSYCTNTHTYVRALTKFKNEIAWRLIRINAACVCVLSRKTWRH
ncbi:neurotrophin-7 [Denticeps clupeoides]|uniref:Nerve growth factor-related domain-containing protein n=1 Tax=Denticeps clupeoides TaxID=299321 RepID=A0AAY4CN71_9TELE|nr:neurotrophin-7-like [Denticeps clupeoides]